MDRPITVVQAEGPVHTFNSSGANRGTYLFFGNKHYELLEVSPEAKLALHTKAMPGKTGGGRESARGGGKASSLGGQTAAGRSLGGLTAITSSPQRAVLLRAKESPRKVSSPFGGATVSKVSLGGCTKVSLGGLTRASPKLKVGKHTGKGSASRKNLGGHTAVAGGNKATSSADVAVLEDLDGLVDESQTTNLELSRYRTVQQVWVCPYCQQSFTKTGKSPLHRVWRNHLRGRHKDENLTNRIGWGKSSQQLWPPRICRKKRGHGHVLFVTVLCLLWTRWLMTTRLLFTIRVNIPEEIVLLRRFMLLGQRKTKNVSNSVCIGPMEFTGLGDKLRKYAADKLGDLDTGHNLVRVNVDPATWPQLLTAAKNGRQPTILTCVTCRRMFQGSGMAAVHKKCQPFPDVPLGATRRMWSKSTVGDRAALCKAWGIPLAEGERWLQSVGPFTGDHDIVKFEVDWDKWPLPRAASCKRGLMLTCRKCRIVRSSINKESAKCAGDMARPFPLARNFWERISPSHVGRQLLRIWGIKKKQADVFFRKDGDLASWKRDLTKEGIHPHPGPTRSCQVHCLNCGGPNGAWRVLDFFSNRSKELVVVALQEIKMTTSEFQAFGRAAKRQGFRCFGLAGTPAKGRWQNDVPRGGVAWLVDHRIPCTQGEGLALNNSQLVWVRVLDFLMLNFYAPPCEGDPQGDAATLMTDVFIKESLNGFAG